MKIERQNKIRELIAKHLIDTQEELLALLKDAGFDVTQATVSRDIKEMRLAKSSNADGKYYYVNNAGVSQEEKIKFNAIFSNAVISIDFALNFVVIKCHSGMAQAACAALDSMNFEAVVGTLAGDDTIFIVTRSEAASGVMVNSLDNMLRR